MDLKNEIITKLTDRFNESKNTFGFPEENKVLIDACLKVAVEIVANVCESNPVNSKPANCAIFDVSKRYRFTMQDVDTNEIIIIDEDTERKAFRKAFRFLGEKKLKDRELSIVSKVDNVC